MTSPSPTCQLRSCFQYRRSSRNCSRPLFHHLLWKMFLCSVTYLGFSDHSLICQDLCQYRLISCFIEQFLDFPKLTGDSFISFLADAPHSTFFFKNRPPRRAFLISEWILSGIESFIPHNKYPQRLNIQSWYTPECTANPNPYYNLYHPEQCSKTVAAFRTACNHHKNVLDKIYAQQVQDKFESERLDEH